MVKGSFPKSKSCWEYQKIYVQCHKSGSWRVLRIKSNQINQKCSSSSHQPCFSCWNHHMPEFMSVLLQDSIPQSLSSCIQDNLSTMYIIMFQTVFMKITCNCMSLSGAHNWSVLTGTKFLSVRFQLFFVASRTANCNQFLLGKATSLEERRLNSNQFYTFYNLLTFRRILPVAVGLG